MKALIIDTAISVIPWVGNLLIRAGFEVDVITTVPNISLLDTAKNTFYEKKPVNLLNLAIEKVKEKYELVVPCSDSILSLILNSNLSSQDKLKLLPVISISDFTHIYSKIGLSNLLQSHNILTPPFVVANNLDEIEAKSSHFEYEFFLKNDRGAAGKGVFLISNCADLMRYKDQMQFPILMQQKITGRLLDLSAFFQRKKLISFSHSEIIESRPTHFGPSVLRKYYNDSISSSLYCDLLNKLGDALGANGFVNISAIESYDSKLIYIFEADMRPNIWVQHSKFVDDDPAPRIRDFFFAGETYEDKLSQNIKKKFVFYHKIIPHVDRLTNEEVTLNKYDCRLYHIK